jgi:hypothetical protein
VIGPDLVRARRRGEKLTLQVLKGRDRERAVQLAEELLQIASMHLDETHEEVEAALSAVDRDAREEKLFSGLKKLVLDACRFDAPAVFDAVVIRRELFARAASARQLLEPAERIDRQALIAETALGLGLSPAEIEQGLFGDLRGAQQLIQGPEVGAEQLVSTYEVAQIQGILLRAVKVILEVEDSDPGAYRSLFLKLKFRQLLCSVERRDGPGYRVVIDGPFSLFDSVTKYGQKLALLVPVLGEIRSCRLTAEVRWGKERKPLTFSHEFSSAGGSHKPAPVGEAEELVARINAQVSGAEAQLDARILDLPGVGVVVPDLSIRTASGEVVLVEILGFWSREAVWRRVEWAEQRKVRGGAATPVLFVVSSRLRVAGDALAAETSAALHVYKGRISAKALAAQAELLAAAGRGAPRRAPG